MAGPARLKAAGRPDTMDSAQAKSASKAMSEKQTEEEKKGREILKDAGVIQRAPDATAEQEQVITAWAEALKGSPAADYMAGRGFRCPDGQPDFAFLSRWRVGYTSAWVGEREDGTTYALNVQAVTIPTAGGAVFARQCYDCKLDKLAQGGNRRLFNERALYQNEKPVVIVEGEIDALSVMYSAGDIVEAVGLGGLEHWKKVLGLINGGEVQARRFVIALDNDPPEKEDTRQNVRETAEKLRLGLHAADRVAIPADDVYGVDGKGYKDANETLVKEPRRLREKIEFVARLAMSIDDPLEEKRKRYKEENSGLAGLDAFLADDAEPEQPAKTGIEWLDKELLDGGLYEGLYVLLAAPSMGKSTLMLQIADNIAQSGRDVLFVTLEMSKKSLQAKTLSRLSGLLADADSDTFTAMEERAITSGRWRKWGQVDREKAKATLTEASAAYRKRWAERVYFYEAPGGSFAGVLEAVEIHRRVRGCPPVVIVDYLQILQSADASKTDKQAVDAHVAGLKQLSRDYGVPVLVASSLGRTSYAERLTMASGKESGGIEFTADIILGLQFIEVGTSGFDADAAKEQPIRELEIAVLKNRSGSTGSAYIRYWPKWNLMIDASKELKAKADAARKARRESKKSK